MYTFEQAVRFTKQTPIARRATGVAEIDQKAHTSTQQQGNQSRSTRSSMSMNATTLTRRILALQTVKQQLSGARGFAAPGKGKGGSANAIVEEAIDLTRVVPTNIFKEGQHAELKEREEYPEWLFKLLDVQPTLGELERAGFDTLELEQQRRMLTLANRRVVKGNNAAKSKK